MFQTKVVEKIKTRILNSMTFLFFENRAADDNIVHVHDILDTQGYKQTLRICNIYCFYIAKMVTRKDLNVTLHYVHRLSC